jgi:24-methylenesterol C-methyltransferase
MQLEQVYGEIFRVLKPGAVFVSYEWVSTKKFDPKNPDHVKIIDEINFGNGLPVSTDWDRRRELQC